MSGWEQREQFSSPSELLYNYEQDYQFYYKHCQKMNEGFQAKMISPAEVGTTPLHCNLNNLTIKQISFSSQNQLQPLRPKILKPVLPTKIYHNGYYKNHNKTKKNMLPELSNKIIKPTSEGKIMDEIRVSGGKDKSFARSTIRNSRNSEILNSLIQILKNDPDSSTNSGKTRMDRIKTEPSFSNQFMETREISSVKNSRGPKIIGNQIMMMANNGYKRKLVSQEKTRPKIFSDESYSLHKPGIKKLDAFDEMQMTFYKPTRVNISISEHQNTRKLEHNQFINDNS